MRFLPISGVIAVGLSVASAAQAQVAQRQLDLILHDMKRTDIQSLRASCAMGRAPKSVADTRSAGIESPDASAWCVTVLTRQGREGTLGYMRDPRSAQPTPAIAFDSGFVGGYLKHDALPTGAPSMATLLPIAERCLEQGEPNGQLCSSAGYIIGLRAASGETIVAG